MKDLTVPTMQELKRAAAECGMEIYLIRPCGGMPIGTLYLDDFSIDYGRTGGWKATLRRARYLVGRHIEAVNRAKEAGL